MNLPERVHLIGIGGTGMSSLARYLLEEGLTVTGSDLSASDTTLELERRGATVYIGHGEQNVNGAQLVVTSTAIGQDNPELAQARAAGIPVVHRSEVWARILNSGRGIAIAGAHGKTTVTAMLAWVLTHCGLDPSYLIGGEVAGLGSGHRGAGDIVVAEADESDGSFLRYRPWCTVITRIEPDHLEHYDGSFDELVSAYGAFLSHTKPEGFAVLCSDDPKVMQLAAQTTVPRVTYGLTPGGDFTAADIEQEGFRTAARVVRNGQVLGKLELRVPGRHNVQNALAVAAVCTRLGLSWDDIAPHLATYRGAKRRFEVVAEGNGLLVIDDYAHHPSEVRATLAAARSGWPQRRIIAVFQPHRYARTHFLLDEFATSFADADHVVLTDIYAPAAEKPIPGTSGARLAERVRSVVPEGVTVDFVPARTDVAAHLRTIVRPGDVVVTMGAGDIWRTAREFVQAVGNPT